ncbi:MAG: bifunctional precorrin-2 dehydrogenase/sirohydrochlorin ferrochelatase [Deltaproteobacteria bacterium]|nr:bifunctional precorrin-2 dehydrogenase/sirohydrochlorin ferrochelatase [Deltaproteobacteria bacterium]
MSYYPILVDLEGQTVLVVGGGAVAQRKIDSLLECGACVKVISRDLTPELKRYVDEGKIIPAGREFTRDALEGVFLAVVATDDNLLNRVIGEAAKESRILVNVVDQPEDCNFIVPSIIRRGDLVIAVSTSGRSPAMAKKIRERLGRLFGDEYGLFLTLMGRLRKEILSFGMSQEENSRIFHELVESPVLEAIEESNWNKAALNVSRITGKEFTPEDIIEYLKVN